MRRPLLSVTAAALLALCFSCSDKKGRVAPNLIKDVVPVLLDEDGFHPDRIPAEVGRPITLVFTRKVEKTCATAVVIAQENIRRDLPMNLPTMVTFIPEKPGNVHFACPMNMITGEIAVQDVEAVVETKGNRTKVKMKKIPSPQAPAMPAPAMPAPAMPAPAMPAPAMPAPGGAQVPPPR